MITEGSTRTLSLLVRNWLPLLGVITIVSVEEIANDYFDLERAVFSMAATALMVAALSFFLVFRMNEAYARWWEARTVWGGIVNASRNFARQATTLLVAKDASTEEEEEVEALRRELVRRQIAWVNALRIHLRQQDTWEMLTPFLQDTEHGSLADAVNKPTQIMQHQGVRVAQARAAGRLSDFGLRMIDRTMSELTNAQGACERIKNTPLPDRITRFTQVIAWALAVFISLGIIDTEGFDLVDLVVIPFMMMAFVIAERLAAEIKNPFENQPNDTPMTALCRTIEIDLRQQLGEEDLPKPLEPVKGVLM